MLRFKSQAEAYRLAGAISAVGSAVLSHSKGRGFESLIAQILPNRSQQCRFLKQGSQSVHPGGRIF